MTPDPLLLPPDPLWVARILVWQQQAIVCRLLAIVAETGALTHRPGGATMLTIEEARTRVARGAAHLDHANPGWFQRIDVGTLTLSSCYSCTLGQLYGGFHQGLAPLGLTFPEGQWRRNTGAVKQGFMLAPRDSDNGDEEWQGFGLLQDAWIAAIADRRLSQAIDQPAHDAAVDRHVCSTGTR